MSGRGTTRRSLFRRRDGTAAVELALISPMLMILLAGIIDFGRAYREEIELSSAVAAANPATTIAEASICAFCVRAVLSKRRGSNRMRGCARPWCGL